MQWYYSKNATQLGPVTEEELRAKIACGEVTASDMVWKDGMPDWKPAASVPELGSMIPVAAAVVPNLPGYQNSPYQPPSVPSYGSGMPIPNYLWQSIVVTILCCWPLGIPAIVYAAKVDGLVARGDIQGAMSASASAKTWCWVAFFSWLGLVVIYLLFVLIGFGTLHSST